MKVKTLDEKTDKNLLTRINDLSIIDNAAKKPLKNISLRV